uniref:Uncharacterized protein n=1 Tax=viral metagenome TaxID=1070528 RepID=A0A6C0KC16_9ZZZZ
MGYSRDTPGRNILCAILRQCKRPIASGQANRYTSKASAVFLVNVLQRAGVAPESVWVSHGGHRTVQLKCDLWPSVNDQFGDGLRSARWRSRKPATTFKNLTSLIRYQLEDEGLFTEKRGRFGRKRQTNSFYRKKAVGGCGAAGQAAARVARVVPPPLPPVPPPLPRPSAAIHGRSGCGSGAGRGSSTDGAAAKIAGLKELIKQATDAGDYDRLPPLVQQIKALETPAAAASLGKQTAWVDQAGTVPIAMGDGYIEAL